MKYAFFIFLLKLSHKINIKTPLFFIQKMNYNYIYEGINIFISLPEKLKTITESVTFNITLNSLLRKTHEW